MNVKTKLIVSNIDCEEIAKADLNKDLPELSIEELVNESTKKCDGTTIHCDCQQNCSKIGEQI